MARRGTRDDTGESAPTAELLEAYAAASGTALVALTSEGDLVSYSERFATMWGVPRDVLAQGSLSPVVEWLLARGGDTGAALARVLTGRDVPAEGERALADGRTVSWKRVGIGAGGGHVWAFRDVTASHQVVSALHDAGHLLRILEAHADGMLLELDGDVRVVGVWATAAAYFEKPGAILQGSRLADALGEPHGSTFDAVVRRVFATGRRESFEYVVDAAGDKRVFAATVLLMPSDDDEPPRATVAIRDVTERARMQAQLVEAERVLSVGLLAAGV